MENPASSATTILGATAAAVLGGILLWWLEPFVRPNTPLSPPSATALKEATPPAVSLPEAPVKLPTQAKTSHNEAIPPKRASETTKSEPPATVAPQVGSVSGQRASLKPETLTEAQVRIEDFDGDWESQQFKYGFHLKSGRGTATLSNSTAFAPGDTIIKVERISNGRFYGQQLFTNGSWVKISGKLADENTLQLNGGGFNWTMSRQ